MTDTTLKHYSNCLELKKFKGKHFLTDRTKLKVLLPGIVFGFLLSLLGIYDQLNLLKGGVEGLVPNRETMVFSPVFDACFFDFCFIIIGLGIIANNIITFLCYNKYVFDGKKVTIIKRRFLSAKSFIDENLNNYTGVRFRIEFLHWGFFNKNRYIIELYNENAAHIIPLYISISSNDVRKMWKKYAKTFRLPAMINTDEGLKSLELKNLDKSINQLYKLGLIKDNYNSYESLPKGVVFVRKKDKIVLKIRKIVWDAYNILAWMFVAWLILFFGIYFIRVEQFDVLHYVYMALDVVLISVIIQILFRKEKLVIKQNKIVNTHKYFFFSTKHNEIFKKDIETIEVTENPATGRYFVAIISESNTIAFGVKMNIKTLEWIKKFLIHEIVK